MREFLQKQISIWQFFARACLKKAFFWEFVSMMGMNFQLLFQLCIPFLKDQRI